MPTQSKFYRRGDGSQVPRRKPADDHPWRDPTFPGGWKIKSVAARKERIAQLEARLLEGGDDEPLD